MKSFFGIFVVLTVLMFAFIDRNKESDKDKTMDRAQQVGQALISKDFYVGVWLNAAADVRGPASVNNVDMKLVRAQILGGEYARDHWGYPFRYQVIEGSNRRLVIWSAGENHIFDTPEKQLAENTFFSSNLFAKDDLGVVIPIASAKSQ